MNLNNLNKSYPHQKPRPTLQVFLLGAIVVSGLIALFFAAYHAFRLVADPQQAFFAALLIEAGLIAECFAIISKPRTVAPWLGLIVSYVVSGTYNYTQAAAVGQGLGSWELWALAFGPLSALAVVSLSFGNELRDHQERVAVWLQNRAVWVNSERQRIEQVAQAQEQKRLELEAKHAEKMARIAAKSAPANQPQISRKSAGGSRVTPAERRKFAVNILRENPDISGAKLAEYLGASERTGQNILRELEQSGAVHRNGNGWEVTR